MYSTHGPGARPAPERVESHFSVADDDFCSAWPGEQMCHIDDDYRSWRDDRYRGTQPASTDAPSSLPAPAAERSLPTMPALKR